LRSNLLTRAAAVLAVAALAGAAQAHDYDLGPLHIDRPWIAAPPPGAPTAAGYLSITNHGHAPDRLIAVVSPDVRDIQVHQMSMTGQIMRMRPVAGGLAIAPGQTVSMTPGGDHHLMLVGPAHPLKLGEHIPATLRFEKAGSIPVVFVVGDPDGRVTPPMHPMAMHPMGTH
jgi:hypothetical protein